MDKPAHEIKWEEAPETIALVGEIREEIAEAFTKAEEVRKDAKEKTDPYLDIKPFIDPPPPIHAMLEVDRYSRLVDAYNTLAWETIYRYFPVCAYHSYKINDDMTMLTKAPKSKKMLALEKMYEIKNILEQQDIDEQ